MSCVLFASVEMSDNLNHFLSMNQVLTLKPSNACSMHAAFHYASTSASYI